MLLQDLRYAVRSLRHTPLYALTIVGSLVLGIGANVTVFTLMHAALWRDIPVSHPEEIVHVRRANPARSDGRETSVSYTLYRELRDAAGSSAQVVAKGTPRRRAFSPSRPMQRRPPGAGPAFPEEPAGSAPRADWRAYPPCADGRWPRPGGRETDD